MQKRIWFFTAAIVLLVVFCYSGCNVDTIEETASGPDANAVFSVAAEPLDFGLTEAEAEEKVSVVTLSNTSDYTLTITSVSISDDENYSIDIPALPLTLEPGDTVSGECNFHPVISGALTGEISTAVEGFQAPASMTVSGEENYARLSHRV